MCNSLCDARAAFALVVSIVIDDHNVMQITIYGIPTCGTVKKAQAWMRTHGLDAAFVDFRRTPPSKAQVTSWVEALGARAMRNTSGASYRSLPADKDTWSESTWATEFAADLMLVKRPIIEVDGAPKMVGFRGDDCDLKRALGVD